MANYLEELKVAVAKQRAVKVNARYQVKPAMANLDQVLREYDLAVFDDLEPDNPKGIPMPPMTNGNGPLTVSQRFSLKPIKLLDSSLADLVKAVYPKIKNEFVGFTPHIGVEVEVENMNYQKASREILNTFPKDFWMDTDDEGSLREFGREYISYPIRGISIEGALLFLRDWWKKNKLVPKFSHRTSIHIHINARDLVEKQVRMIILTYLAFEQLIFNNFISPERQSNVYCIPLADILGEKSTFSVIGWFKYSALNLLPLTTLGTLEFRHMEGNLDIDRIKEWVKIINHIYKFGQTKKKEEIDYYFNTINSDSGYANFGKEVFGKDWNLLNKGDISQQMENNVLLCKLLKDKELF